jgi:short-subunit dehydrogenase
MKPLDFTGKWILITGASSGLGREMAYQLGRKHKANLILLARRAELLREIKEDLEKGGDIQVEIWPVDLSDPGQVADVTRGIIETGRLDGAILNAGITYFGRHTELTDAEFDKIIQVNIKSVSYMTTQLARYFEDAGKDKVPMKNGAPINDACIMLVSSMAAFLPTPYQAVYSATKAFLVNFANALQFEVRNPYLSITVFAPGGIATEMTQGEKFNDLRGWLMPVEQAARIGIRALQRRKYIAVPGLSNKAGFLLSRLLSRKFMVKQLGKTYGKALISAQIHTP